MTPNEILIGVAGPARSGKDTVAQYLVDDYGLSQAAFAAPIKRGLANMFGLPRSLFDGDEKELPIEFIGRSPRELMQALGDWARGTVGADVFMTLAECQVRALRNFAQRDGIVFPGVVFSDLRTEGEAAWIREHGGHVLHVRRADRPQIAEHHTENGLIVRRGDLVLVNDDSIDALYAKTDDAMASMFGETDCAGTC